MKNKNTMLSVVRHTLTVVVGALWMLGKVDASAWEMFAGGVLGLAGLQWGATDEHQAENQS